MKHAAVCNGLAGLARQADEVLEKMPASPGFLQICLQPFGRLFARGAGLQHLVVLDHVKIG